MSAKPRPIRLAHHDSGGTGPAVLLVHGLAHNRQVWSGVATRLGDRYRTIAVDLRGHGESDWSPAGDYDLPDYAADLLATLDALGIDRAFVVAHSLGGNAATLLAAEAPQRIAGLVLVDTGPALSASSIQHIATDVNEALRSFDSLETPCRRLAQLHPQADPQVLERVARAGAVRRRDGRYEPALDPGVISGPPDGTSPRRRRGTPVGRARPCALSDPGDPRRALVAASRGDRREDGARRADRRALRHIAPRRPLGDARRSGGSRATRARVPRGALNSSATRAGRTSPTQRINAPLPIVARPTH